MESKKRTILIMAGGSGERFWPLSTRERAKQFLKLVDSERSLLQMSVERVLPLLPISQIYISTNALQAAIVREQIPQLPQQNLIVEPLFRDTAAAIGFASLIIKRENPDATLIVLASDHLIENEELFRETLLLALKGAEEQRAIVTLGITPTSPHTGYGYLELEGSSKGEPLTLERVLRFCEKPSLKLATQYLKGGRHLWNSGIFIFSIEVMMEAFRELLPGHHKILGEMESLGERVRDYKDSKLVQLFNLFERISIDYGVMEHFTNTLVIPSNFGWSDVGSYTALKEIMEQNSNGSVVRGAVVKEVESSNNIVISTTGKEISLLGVEGMVIVEGENNILICSQSEAQNIKKLLE